MTNQADSNLTQPGRELDDQQLKAVAGGFKTGFEEGMAELNKGMAELDKGMAELDKGLQDGSTKVLAENEQQVFS